MPGIVGIITTNPNAGEATERLNIMLGCMLHEPFYTSGAHAVPELGCYVGWVNRTRGSPSESLAVDSTGQVALVFSGEHFCEGPSLVTHLRVLRLPASCSNTSGPGEQFVEHLNGWFSGVLIDRRCRTTRLFLDRFGMHRVYLDRVDGLVLLLPLRQRHCWRFIPSAEPSIRLRSGSSSRLVRSSADRCFKTSPSCPPAPCGR